MSVGYSVITGYKVRWQRNKQREWQVFTTATVTAQDGAAYGVYVMFDGPMGGQVSPQAIPVMTWGPRDAVRGNYPSLPTPGTRGLVAFPRGDVRNAVWLGSIPGPLNTAAIGLAASGNVGYSAGYSGLWELIGADGSTATVWPDGSSAVVGNGGDVPAVTRTIVDESRQAVTQDFAQAQRVANPPAAFPLVFRHSSGTVVTIAAAGAVEVDAVAGQAVTLRGSGGKVQITGTGAVTAQAGSGRTATMVSGGGTVEVDGGGNVVVVSPGTISITGTGVIEIDGGANVNINSVGLLNLAGGARAVARIGDLVSGGGTIITGSPVVFAG